MIPYSGVKLGFLDELHWADIVLAAEILNVPIEDQTTKYISIKRNYFR